MKPVTVTWDGGVRFTADVRGHKLVVDQPPQGGGQDAGPMPLELVPAALGTCVALFVKQFLVTRGLDAAGLTVQVFTATEANPHRIGRFEVTVAIPKGVPEHYREAVARVAESCTVHHTLTHQPEIAVEVLETVPTA
ncbi:MAG TPA: OsmC family protein [Gemmatimonadales bacterium]|nr:OsmC family protein [Gemmatimonadales bacterium]